jgi:glycosyltransferase involved in cell wall biosynthesis
MHIVIFTPQYPGPGDRKYRGLYIKVLAEALSHTHQVTVVTHYPVSIKEMLKPPPEPVSYQHEGVTVYQVRYFRIPYLILLIRILTFFWGARKLNWDEVDRVHANWFIPAGFAAACLSRWHRKSFFLTEHRGKFAEQTSSFLLHRIAHWTIKQTQRVIVVSRSLQKSIEEQGMVADFAVIPNAFDTNIFFLSPEPVELPTDEFRFLWVSSFRARDAYQNKGGEVLLQALSFARPRLPRKLHLTVVGYGTALLADFEAQARRWGVADICHIVGGKANHELRNLMWQSHSLIVASMVESFGMVLIEAMGCGKPVVATRCGGPEDIVTPETGILVESHNPQALADGIVQMVEAYDSYDPKAISSYAHTKYNASTIVEQIEQIYQKR